MIKSLTFNTEIKITGNLVVFLGPSNCGKSTCFEEIEQWLNMDYTKNVQNSIVVKKRPECSKDVKTTGFFNENCKMLGDPISRHNMFRKNSTEQKVTEIFIKINKLIGEVFSGQQIYSSSLEEVLCWGNPKKPSARADL